MAVSSLAVEKTKKQVTLFLSDQSRETGYVFLSPYSQTGVGRQTVLEVLTGRDPFLPFETRAGQLVFVNQDQIVWAAHFLDEDEIKRLPAQARSVTVTLTDGKRLRGTLLVEAPEERSRLSDLVNHLDAFLTLRDAKREVLINLDFAVSVEEN
jgi:hypothetical protein